MTRVSTSKSPAVKKQKNTTRRSGPEKNAPYVVCIGASAGGLSAVLEVLSGIPKDINAAVFVLLHFSTTSAGDLLAERVRSETGMGVRRQRTMR